MRQHLTLSLISMVCVLFGSCNTEDDLEGKNVSYTIVNISKFEMGIKVTTQHGVSGFKLLEESMILKPGEERTFLKSAELEEPAKFIHAIEVYNKAFTERYKVLDLSGRIIEGTSVSLQAWMPNPKSKDIVKNNVGVTFHLNENSIYGYYPKNEITEEVYFFNTSDEFENIFKTQLPQVTYRVKTIQIFGNTIVAYDRGVYEENTSFIVSHNKGISWTPFLSASNGPTRDFVATDFISPEEGWFFTYDYFDSTSVYKIHNGTYNRISTLNNYHVVDCKFIDSNTGYVVGNTKENGSPSLAENTYFCKTQDGGITWGEPLLISSTESPGKLFAFPSGKLILMRNNFFEMHRSFYLSDDDGLTWELVDAQTEGFIRDMHFISEDIGYIKTGTNSLWSQSNFGFVYKTSDGGRTWNKIPSINLLGSKVYFYNEQIGYLQDLFYGKGQVLLITRDGGKTWKDVLYPFDYLID